MSISPIRLVTHVEAASALHKGNHDRFDSTARVPYLSVRKKRCGAEGANVSSTVKRKPSQSPSVNHGLSVPLYWCLVK